MGRSVEREYVIDRAGVDAVSEEVTKWLAECGSSKENTIRIRFAMEEAMLGLCEHFDEKLTGTLITGRRFGAPVLRFRYEGDEFNPFGDEIDEFTDNILSEMGLRPDWQYRSGVNEIVLKGPGRHVRSEILLIGAAVLAVVVALLAGMLPEAVVSPIYEYIFSPVADAFLNALNTFVGIMMFLSVVAGICSVGSVSEFNRVGKYVITRFIRMTFIGSVLCAILVFPLFSFRFGEAGGGTSQAGVLVELVFSIIPSDPVTPFAEGNTLQIVFMAALTGVAMLVLGERVGKVRELVLQASDIFMRIINTVCRLLPIYIFASLTVLIRENGMGLFTRIWKPLVIFAVFSTAMLAASLIYYGVRLRASPVLLFKKISGCVIGAFVTASSAAVFGRMMEAEEEDLGVSPDFNKIAMPFGNLLSGASSGAMLVVVTYYLAESFDIAVGFSWFITMLIMCSVLGMTLPPVSGSMLIAIGILMKQFDIPQAGLATAGVLGIVLDFFACGVKIGQQMLEVAVEADHFGMVDKDRLAKIREVE